MLLLLRCFLGATVTAVPAITINPTTLAVGISGIELVGARVGVGLGLCMGIVVLEFVSGIVTAFING